MAYTIPKNSRDQRHKLKATVRSIRQFEKIEDVTPVTRMRVKLPDGAKSIISTLADGRQYGCGYL